MSDVFDCQKWRRCTGLHEYYEVFLVFILLLYKHEEEKQKNTSEYKDNIMQSSTPHH